MHPALHIGTAGPAQAADVAFLFGGGELVHSAAGRLLYETSQVFRTAIDECDSALRRHAGGRRRLALPWLSADDAARPEEPGAARSVLFAMQYATAQLWQSFGVRPAAVIGSADGEPGAACVAGVLSLEDALHLVSQAASLAPARGCSPDMNGTPAALAHTPTIPIAWTSGGSDALGLHGIPDADYWCDRHAEPTRVAEAFRELHHAGCRRFMEMATTATLIPIAQRALPEAGNLFLTPLHAGADDWAGMNACIAELYVHGAVLDWAEVNKGGRKIHLPTYPFEHRSYWYAPTEIEDQYLASACHEGPLTGNPLPSAAARSMPASPSQQGGVEDSPAGTTGDDLFYQVLWEKAPLVRRGAPWLHGPEQYSSWLQQRFSTLAVANDLAIYDRVGPALDRLSAAFVGAALQRLGFDATAGRIFTADEEAVRLGVAPRQNRLFARMLVMLAEDGVLRRSEAWFTVVTALPSVGLPAEGIAEAGESGVLDAELMMLQRCGTALPRVLTGEQDALPLLFVGGSFEEARKLYVSSPWARTYNATLGEALASAIRNLPADASLRLLEIGAGTGGTTDYILPLLPADRTDYVFTDLSPLFLERAAQRYAAYPFLRTALLDVENDPSGQGFHAGQFDVIVAANVLHATRDLSTTMEHVRSLLAPGGLLLLLEVVAPQRSTDLTFGLTEGWWRFSDTALRPDYPLIDTAAWRRLLQHHGFDDVAAIPAAGQGTVAGSRQALIVAQRSRTTCAWALVGDDNGIAAALAERLRGQGQQVRVLDAAAPQHAALDNEELVYLGALPLARYRNDDAAAVPLCEALACQLPVQWLARFGRAAHGGRAWLVTQGAQAVQGAIGPGGRWQSPLWGVGRTFAVEQPDRWGGLIDLAPDDDVGSLAETLLSAIAAGDGEDQTAYRGGGRYLARLDHAPPPAPAPIPLRADATYLITGGFGGLGLLLARWLADHGAKHIALLGRHPDTAGDAVRAIEAMDVRIHALAGDIADEQHIRSLLAALTTEAPPIRGIFHAATHADATPIDRLTPEQMATMLRPKIAGAVVLERVLQHDDLDFLVFYSSTAALIGSGGMAHYAAANAFLDATALAASPAQRVLSINWGAWERIRMASEDAQRGFHAGGLEPISADAGFDAMARLLASAQPQGIVARIDWSRYKPLFETRRSRPFLSRFGSSASPEITKPTSGGVGTAGVGTGAMASRLAQASGAARATLIWDFVCREVAAVLNAEADATAPDQDLFATGLDSLMSIELKRRLEAGIGQSLPSSLTFNYPTIDALTTFLGSLAGASPVAGPETTAAAIAAQRPDTHPLSYSQKALWFLQQQDPHSAAYHVSLSVRVLSRLDTALLRTALQAVIDRHAILRTTYDFHDNAPCQRVSVDQDAALSVHVVGALPDSELRTMLGADAGRPFDLQHGPVIRASVYTRRADDHALLVSVHHIAIDGWSILMLIEELLKLYGELAGGPAVTFDQPEREYSDYVRWQEAMLGGTEGDRLWSYWQRQLALPRQRLALPTDHPPPPIQSFDGATFAFQPPTATIRQVMDLARKERTTPFVVLLAGFQAFLFHLTGTEDVIVGTSVFARSKPEFMRVVGNFVSSVPIRGRLSGPMTFRELVRQLGTAVVGAIEAQEFPLPLLVQRLQPERTAGSSPLFETFFSFLRFPQLQSFGLLYGRDSDDPIDLATLRLRPFSIEQGAGQFDLSLQMVDIAGDIRAAFTYRTDLFEETTIRRYAEEFLMLLDSLTSNQDAPLLNAPGPHGGDAAATDEIAVLLSQLGQRDIRLVLDGDRLRINAPRGALDAALKAAITDKRAAIVAHLQAAADNAQLRRLPRTTRIPATSAQQRLWFLDRIDPGQASYNIGGGLRFRGVLDIDCLGQAIQALMQRHEAFRTRVVEAGGRPWLEVLQSTEAASDVIDLCGFQADQRDAEARRLGEELLRCPFDMARGSLAAFRIIRMAADDHVLILTMHHVIADGWSLAIACHELCMLYEALVAGRGADLAALAIDYVDYAGWEAKQLQAGGFDADLAYWQTHLQGAPAMLDLPMDRPRPPIPSHRGGRVCRFLDGALIAALEAYGRRHNATLFMTLLAAWQVLMYRHSGQEDVVIGTPMANRDIPALEGVVGCLVNNVVMRGRLGRQPQILTSF